MGEQVTNLEALAKAVVLGIDCEDESIHMVCDSDGSMFVRQKRTTWSGSVAEWQAALLAVLDVQPYYPQLTEWVRAQPSGASLLVVWSAEEPMAAFSTAAAHQKVVTMIREADLNSASFGHGDDYQSVWLSRHVSPECEAKIPRGVKVYRER